MTPYQRGNRDGLRNVAALLREHAGLHRAEAERMKVHRERPGLRMDTHRTIQRLLENAVMREQDYLTAADLAERLAEALPDDPEAPESTPVPR